MRQFSCLFIFISSILFSQNKDVFDVARKGNIQEMQSLISINKDTINAKNKAGFTPLLLACYRGNDAVVTFLVDKVKNINEISMEGTALTAAVFQGNIKISKLLLEKGANPNIQNVQGVTPLMYAIQTQNVSLVKLLLEFHADQTIKDKQGKTAFEYAIFSKNQEIINNLKK